MDATMILTASVVQSILRFLEVCRMLVRLRFMDPVNWKVW